VTSGGGEDCNDVQGDWAELGFGGVKPKVIPVVRYQGGEVQNDSTFILESLDQRFPARWVRGAALHCTVD
jgi:hypothetical protein